VIFTHYIKNKAITATNQNFPAKKVHFTCKTKVKEVLKYVGWYLWIFKTTFRKI